MKTFIFTFLFISSFAFAINPCEYSTRILNADVVIECDINNVTDPVMNLGANGVEYIGKDGSACITSKYGTEFAASYMVDYDYTYMGTKQSQKRGVSLLNSERSEKSDKIVIKQRARLFKAELGQHRIKVELDKVTMKGSFKVDFYDAKPRVIFGKVRSHRLLRKRTSVDYQLSCRYIRGE